MQKYIRDGRSPIPTSNNVSKVMSANKAKNTKPELTLRKAMYRVGVRGYRLHMKNIPGRPDIVFIKKRLAIFINGCFWHRCPKCNLPLPKSNTAFWKLKFDSNIRRDLRKVKELEIADWEVLTFWECEINEDVEFCINTIQDKLGI